MLNFDYRGETQKENTTEMPLLTPLPSKNPSMVVLQLVSHTDQKWQAHRLETLLHSRPNVI